MRLLVAKGYIATISKRGIPRRYEHSVAICRSQSPTPSDGSSCRSEAAAIGRWAQRRLPEFCRILERGHSPSGEERIWIDTRRCRSKAAIVRANLSDSPRGRFRLPDLAAADSRILCLRRSSSRRASGRSDEGAQHLTYSDAEHRRLRSVCPRGNYRRSSREHISFISHSSTFTTGPNPAGSFGLGAGGRFFLVMTSEMDCSNSAVVPLKVRRR